MGRTTITIHDETMKRLIKIRGKMELTNGNRRNMEDIINELADYFENPQKEG